MADFQVACIRKRLPENPRLFLPTLNIWWINKNQGGEPQTVQIVRQGESTLYWFLLIHYIKSGIGSLAVLLVPPALLLI